MIDDTLLYERIYTIRRFEETLLENFPKGVFYGTTHTSLGQEADAVGVLSHLAPGDVVFSNHRGHGHFLAAGGDPRALFAELMGRTTGVCGGRGGSQHLCWGNFYSNGVQGGIAPVATGMALAEKYQQSGAIVIAFLGDGTLGEGVVYEALNMAALWEAPILYVLENNRIAQTTPIEQAVAGSISGRFAAFGIPVAEGNNSDVRSIYSLAGEQLDLVRNERKPHALILHTLRFGPHSKGDDTRPPEEIERLRQQRDPLTIQATRLDAESLEKIKAAVNLRLEQAYQAALADPYPSLTSQVDDAHRPQA